MQRQGIIMPGYRVYEYMLILNPHPDLREKISAVREEFNKQFKVEKPLTSTPNLGIANFMQYAFKEESIVKKLRAIAMSFAPFKVEIKDFGNYPAHTLFFNVTSKLPVQNLVREIRTQTQALMKLNQETKPHFFLEPHITLAMKLKPWQFEKSWLEYSCKHFTGRFIADAMLLLKRAEGEKPWQIFQRLEFQNLLVPEIKQGELFS